VDESSSGSAQGTPRPSSGDGCADAAGTTAQAAALGTHDEIAGQLRVARERWGINYFVVRDAEGFAPVIELLRSL